MDNARKIAKEEDTSINQLFVSAIAEKLSAIQTETLLSERGKRADITAYKKVLSKIRRGPVREGDEL
jgi:hypothetical protein